MPRSAPESKSARFEQYTSAIAADAWPTSPELPVRDGDAVGMQLVPQQPDKPIQEAAAEVDKPSPQPVMQPASIGHNSGDTNACQVGWSPTPRL